MQVQQTNQVPDLSSLRLRPSFVDEIAFDHEPREEVGRYLLHAERQLQHRGLHTVLLTPEELLELNTQERSSWPPLMPVFDPRYHTIQPTEMITVASVDDAGAAIATMSVRRLRVATTVREEFESLRMFYGEHAAEKRLKNRFILTAPSAPHLKGDLYYNGGLWVRPDWRHASMPAFLTRILRYAALTSWNAELEIGIGTEAFTRPDVAPSYDYAHTEHGFELHLDGKWSWRGVFMWIDRADIRANLSKDLTALSQDQADTTEAISNRSTPSRRYGSNKRR